MSQDSSIQWTHHTFNPWSGCAKVHRGCTHCYAEALVPSMRRHAAWGEVWQGGQRVVAAEGYWRLPLAWARAAALLGERQRVFCASTADVLEVPSDPPFAQLSTRTRTLVNEARAGLDTARQRLWDVIRTTAVSVGDEVRREVVDPELALRRWPGLDWLLLTKRPENWHLVPEDVRPLVWLGTSVSDQRTADEWVPRLLKAEGFRLRFLSVEPLTGSVNLRGLLLAGGNPAVCVCGHCHGFTRCPNTGGVSQECHVRGCPCPGFRKVVGGPIDTGIHWVIVGGESGRKAEPCQVEWVRDVVRQCREAGVPCFVKQLGAVPALAEAEWKAMSPTPLLNAHNRSRVPEGVVPLALVDSKGGDTTEWPEDLRVRQLPRVETAR